MLCQPLGFFVILRDIDSLDLEDDRPRAIVAAGDHHAVIICPALHDGAPLECRIHIAVDGVPCLTTELAVHQMVEIVLLWRAFEKKGIARFEERAGPGLGIGQIPSRLASPQLLNLHYMRTTEEKQGRNSPAGNLNLKVPEVKKNSFSFILHVV